MQELLVHYDFLNGEREFLIFQLLIAVIYLYGNGRYVVVIKNLVAVRIEFGEELRLRHDHLVEGREFSPGQFPDSDPVLCGMIFRLHAPGERLCH